MTVLSVFCAARMPPSLVATMPSALLPVPFQMDFHFCPAAITPGISITAYSLGAGGPAAALLPPPRPAPPPAPAAAPCPPAPPPPRPPRAAGGVLHLPATNSAYLASDGAWTPGPCCGAA